MNKVLVSWPELLDPPVTNSFRLRGVTPLTPPRGLGNGRTVLQLLVDRLYACVGNACPEEFRPPIT
jgi:hypothetical protein